MSTLDNLSDNINAELDSRKLNALVDTGAISASDLANAPILSVSECCGADMLGEETTTQLTCSACGKPCEGAEL